MQFRLGYVAISLTLEDLIHYRTLTYTSYQKLGPVLGNQKLDEIITYNFSVLKEILQYNERYDIHFYRMSHNIIPLATHLDVDFDYIKPYLKEWKEIGKIIRKQKIRVDLHPDQFCVLNSSRPEIVLNSFRILEFNYQLFQAMGINGKAILHVGSSVDGKEDSIKRFKDNFRKLAPEIQQMIILENDDKIYTITDVLEICEELHIPMVLDYHHYNCHHEREKLTDYLPRIFATWETTGLLPKIHFSSPKSQKEKRTHSIYLNLKEFLKFLGILKPFEQDVDIMLECKGKDEGLFRLSRQLQTFEFIETIDTSTFHI